MDFSLENCIIKPENFSVARLQKFLHCNQLFTIVLLDLRLLEENINRLGKDMVIAGSLSGNEIALLDKFTSAKRYWEWIGGRFAAKFATGQLLDQVYSHYTASHWSAHVIDTDENSRPFLSAGTETSGIALPDISISHSGSMAAAMAAEKGLCGIDIQKRTPKVIKVSDRFCTGREMQILQKTFPGTAEEPLTKLWAAKEALRKASNKSSLPGFLELELIEINWNFPQKEPVDPGVFFFNGNKQVAVGQIREYALALTVSDDNVV